MPFMSILRYRKKREDDINLFSFFNLQITAIQNKT
ncbi:hypothetical protein SAMN04488574_103154 [Bacillus sp. 71mf]|nr:hypothetical protein SAMN04488574_103154 [Bacillus sp. 71mf]SFS48278.1 hypothetical protein SAMN04488145_101748 [Bacillus sp. 103mf]